MDPNAPANLNLLVNVGSSFVLPLTFLGPDRVTPTDLTNAYLSLQAWPSLEGCGVTLDLDSATKGGITITPGTSGTASVNITAAMSKAVDLTPLPFGWIDLPDLKTAQARLAVYQASLTMPGNDPIRVLEGQMGFAPGGERNG